mmetsp:Transcript_611/g.440  ORF Transcript_611/g.440 Transcript_611/m.440 type:complete len:598 (-) Transcript_611:257-2050(-)|eukprot:CAMPEP_0201285668 /NCGR_PEP_ID=MMETSP1317-20130820/113668_1 /ASSEMBLY_ACC=CAM_ASM_000770 /TAXON_ID=187299 /ORGANISM="Undescribed Undescribed, Strain Undescribed" /LENGTH=597 /DNA_ID=CAMNT_0047611425 /DNA_START=2471 /DNA_END=4264 /DNA_ORIENTATION=-
MNIKGGEFLIKDISSKDIFIPEDFNKEHEMLLKAILEFVRKKTTVYSPEELKADNGKIIRELILEAGELGMLGAAVPAAFGGEEMDAISGCIIAEAVGYGKGGSFSTTFAAHTGIGSLPLVYFGNEEQKKKYLPSLCKGDVIASYCLTESEAGSDALNSQTTAVLSDDGKHYILNGEKIFVTNGGWAGLFTLYAKVVEKDQDVQQGRFTAFLVESSFPGVSIGAEEDKMGLRGSSTTSVILQDCKVPVENVLYEIGKGHKIAFNILNIGRAKLGQMAVGISQIAIQNGVKQANERKQFGSPISSFGMVKNMLADMAVRSFINQSLQYRLAGTMNDFFDKKKGSVAENEKALEEYAIECSISKVYGSESVMLCTDKLVQIFGGCGFIEDYPAAEAYRDARILRIFEGTDEINRLLVSGTLLKRSLQNRLSLMDSAGEAVDFGKSYDPSVVEFEDTPLAIQVHLLKMAKAIFFTAVRASISSLVVNSEDQELLALLSEMIMEIYAMESGLLRALKMFESKGEDKAKFHIAAVKIYFNEIMPKMAFWAKQVVAYTMSDDDVMATAYFDSINKLATFNPIDTINLCRMIAEKIIKVKKYPF